MPHRGTRGVEASALAVREVELVLYLCLGDRALAAVAEAPAAVALHSLARFSWGSSPRLTFSGMSTSGTLEHSQLGATRFAVCLSVPRRCAVAPDPAVAVDQVLAVAANRLVGNDAAATHRAHDGRALGVLDRRSSSGSSWRRLSITTCITRSRGSRRDIWGSQEARCKTLQAREAARRSQPPALSLRSAAPPRTVRARAPGGRRCGAAGAGA